MAPAEAPGQPRDAESPAPDLRRLEVYLDAEDDLRPALDLPGRQIDPLGDFLNVLVDDRVVATLRKQIDQHRYRQRFEEDRVLRVDVRPPRQLGGPDLPRTAGDTDEDR